MILARISRAFREQNWFAVAIEFVIVVLGVVIGFQISGWNEAQRQQDRAFELVERIDEEFRGFEVVLSQAEQNHIEFEAATENVISAIRQNAVGTTEPDLMMSWLGLVRHVGRPPTRSAVLAEIVASGELSLLPEDLRVALTRFDQDIVRNEYLWPEAASHLTGSTTLFDAVEYTSLRDPRRVLSFNSDLVHLAESDLEALVIYQGALRIAVSNSLTSARDVLAIVAEDRERSNR